jgi:tyrosine-protein phosphatase YwqE
MLFFGRKKETQKLDLGWLGTDLHSHLLPGIDDGSPDLETSITLIKGLAALGYKKIITTPHVLWEIYPNSTEIIIQKLADLKAALATEDLNIDLSAAAEYFIDEHFENDLKTKIPLLCIKDNMVLIEFSMLTAPFDLQEVIFEMQMQGYQPVLAHPERYTYMNSKRSAFEDLKYAGCFFQLNLLSITGYYGKAVQTLAEYLIDNNYYDFAATDLHHDRHLLMLQKLSSSPYFKKLQNLELKNNTL